MFRIVILTGLSLTTVRVAFAGIAANAHAAIRGPGQRSR
jgi:hypothetical protein